MYQPSFAVSSPPTPYTPYPAEPSTFDRSLKLPASETRPGILEGLVRRWQRERRRRKVGRAYDMALEVARMLPTGARVLDVGCGSGYIAHHLSALLGVEVTGIDLQEETEAPINYRQYDGNIFPVSEHLFDAVLLCYVLHHTQDLKIVLTELRRVLRNGGVAVAYEDVPETMWDRVVCAIHDRKWRKRTGPCTFRAEHEWRGIFSSSGFEVIFERRLSRWRNVAHPVARRCYLLKMKTAAA